MANLARTTKESQQPSALKGTLGALADLAQEALTPRSDLGSLSFHTEERLFNNIIELATDIRPLPLEALSEQDISALQGVSTELVGLLREVQSFNLDDDEPAEGQPQTAPQTPPTKRNKLLDRLKKLYGSLRLCT